jgi:endonuclease/exonuclease/phosphatase family metal-dependent hydrolase
MRLATFNIENLFERPRAMNLATWEQGQPAIDDAAQLNRLFNQATYSAADKARMLELLAANGLLATRPNGAFLELRKIRGDLFTVPRNGAPTIVAKGRSNWVGWVDLKKEPVDDEAISNTARIISEVDADVLVLCEVENRPCLQHFCDQFLRPLMKNRTYGWNMVIDGNDQRGIDVGILSRFPITHMRSHITDLIGDSRVFSRDCPEYLVELPGGVPLLVLPNHFASKGSDFSGKRRRQQARRVRQIYDRLRLDIDHVLVAGDLNDHPKGGSLDRLLDSDLVDAMALPTYKGLPGTYGHANANQKLDYLLLSPALANHVTKVEVDRRGFYAPTKWASLPSITKHTKDRYQASDHHCLWAELDW